MPLRCRTAGIIELLQGRGSFDRFVCTVASSAQYRPLAEGLQASTPPSTKVGHSPDAEPEGESPLHGGHQGHSLHQEFDRSVAASSEGMVNIVAGRLPAGKIFGPLRGEQLGLQAAQIAQQFLRRLVAARVPWRASCG